VPLALAQLPDVKTYFVEDVARQSPDNAAVAGGGAKSCALGPSKRSWRSDGPTPERGS